MAVNVPEAQALHLRLLDVVGNTEMCSPGGHGARTAAQRWPSLLVEYVDPAVQEEHTRLEVAVPSVTMPSPAGHVPHAMQKLTPALAVKVPAAHAAHEMSFEVVALTVVCSPAAHGARTGRHADASFVLENVAPLTQATHVRSAIVVPSVSIPRP